MENLSANNIIDHHHKEYIILLFILLFGFFIWSYYLYNFISSKLKKQLSLKQNEELLANNIKYENLKYLSIANLSNIYLIFFS